MRAKEFVIETRRGKQLDAQKRVSPGAVYTPDGVNDLYRAAGIMARLPACVDDLDPYSWITNLPMVVTYTDQEEKMVKAAFKKMGIPYKKHINKRSEEPPAINNASPVKGFKGYPK